MSLCTRTRLNRGAPRLHRGPPGAPSATASAHKPAGTPRARPWSSPPPAPPGGSDPTMARPGRWPGRRSPCRPRTCGGRGWPSRRFVRTSARRLPRRGRGEVSHSGPPRPQGTCGVHNSRRAGKVGPSEARHAVRASCWPEVSRAVFRLCDIQLSICNCGAMPQCVF